MDGFCKGLMSCAIQQQKSSGMKHCHPYGIFRSLCSDHICLWDNCFFLVSAYDRNYFLDRKGVSVLIRADDMAGPMVRLQEDLYQIAGEYRGRILHSDADRALTETMYSVNHQLADGARPYMWDFDMRAQVKTVHKETPVFL